MVPVKKKPGRPKKIEEVEKKPPVVEPEEEEMSDAEIEILIARRQEKKEQAARKVELSVDAQEWTKQDPVIPEELAGRVWIAVYRCPSGHKTKATNRQADSGIQCAECSQAATIVPQFLKKPIVQEDKRKKP